MAVVGMVSWPTQVLLHHHHHRLYHQQKRCCIPPPAGCRRSSSFWSADSLRHRQHAGGIRADARGGSGPGDNESKEVLEAFFLGKAFADAVTERLGTVVGEFLSDVGRMQAEQQKQVQDFQEEVRERARNAKLKALKESSNSNIKAESRSSVNGTVTSSAVSRENRSASALQDSTDL